MTTLGSVGEGQARVPEAWVHTLSGVGISDSLLSYLLPSQAGLFKAEIRERRLPGEQSFSAGVWGGGTAGSITRRSVIFQPSVSTSDLPAITINDNNYNSDLHNAFQLTKRTGAPHIPSSLV